jgi:hypothetical protein
MTQEKTNIKKNLRSQIIKWMNLRWTTDRFKGTSQMIKLTNESSIVNMSPKQTTKYKNQTFQIIKFNSHGVKSSMKYHSNIPFEVITREMVTSLSNCK